MINLVITASTNYVLNLPKGDVRLYGTKFADGSTTKTITTSGQYTIVLDPEPYPNTSYVAEVWVGKSRFETFIVEYPDAKSIDPFYIKNTAHFVKSQDRVGTCPVLYSAGADLRTVTISTQFSDLPTSPFNALDSQELIYERETDILWWLSKSEPIVVTRTEDWSADPIVNFFIYRDTLDTRYFIFVHSSGLIRKLDTVYNEILSVDTGYRFIDAVKYPNITTLSDFVTLDVDGNIRKFGIDFSLKLSTQLVGAIRLYSDLYSLSGSSIVTAVTATGEAYTVSTTMLLTRAYGDNVCGISQRLDSGPTYMWSYHITNGFHLVDSTGVAAGSDYVKAFPLEYSFDATYLRATDGWSQIFIGQAQSLANLPAGSNPYLAFKSSAGNVYYVGRTRNKVPNYVVTEDWYRPQLSVLDFDPALHIARVRVDGVNTELGIDLPDSVNVVVTDFYTGLPITKVDHDTVLVLTGVDDTNLDSKFWITIGKSEIDVTLGGKIYIPDVTRMVGTVVNVIADSLELAPSFGVAQSPVVEAAWGDGQSALFDIMPSTSYFELSSVQSSSPAYVGSAVGMEIDSAVGYQLEYSISSFQQPDPESVPLFRQDVEASTAESNKLVDMFGVESPTAYYEAPAPVPFNDQAVAFDINKLVYAEIKINDVPEAIPFPINTVPNREMSEYPRYITYTYPLACKYSKMPIDYYIETSFSVDLQAPKVTAPLAARWRTISEPYWIGTIFEYKAATDRYWVDTAFVQQDDMVIDRYWIDTGFIHTENYTKYFVDCLPNYKTDALPYPIDLLPLHRKQDYMEHVESVYEYMKVYRFAEYDRGINNTVPAPVWYYVNLGAQYNALLPVPEIYVGPINSVLESAEVTITPIVAELRYADINLDPLPFTVSFSTALAATAYDASTQPTTIAGSPYLTLIADLLSEKVGVDAGYFLTEYAALQNAVNIWGMEPSAIFAKQLSTGYWVWLRTIECENTCDDSVCETFGYITGG